MKEIKATFKDYVPVTHSMRIYIKYDEDNRNLLLSIYEEGSEFQLIQEIEDLNEQTAMYFIDKCFHAMKKVKENNKKEKY